MIDTDYLRRSVALFNSLFKIIIGIDIVVCGLMGNYLLMTSSVILILGLLIAGALFKIDKLDSGIIVIVLTFYTVGFYHVIYLDDFITCYFILLLVPILGIILVKRFYIKMGFFICSALFFLLCNYLAGIPIFENYFFYFGLIPASIMMLHYNNRLEQLRSDNDQFLSMLKEKNNEIMLFSNMMSHDLKAPLRNIEGFSSILSRDLELNEKQKELFSFVTSGVQSMKSLIENLLQYSQANLDEYAFGFFELDKVIDRLLPSFNYDITKNNVVINRSNLGQLYGHEDSLGIVLQNLISNAIKYQPIEGSHIPQIDIEQIDTDTHYQIAIIDNGIGFDPKMEQELFMPFKRFHSESEYEGTGLGMSIVKRIIDKHRGTISVSSRVGVGTTFVIALPIINN